MAGWAIRAIPAYDHRLPERGGWRELAANTGLSCAIKKKRDRRAVYAPVNRAASDESDESGGSKE